MATRLAVVVAGIVGWLLLVGLDGSTRPNAGHAGIRQRHRRVVADRTGLVQRPLLGTRGVGEFAWSPDGSRGSIYLVNADGSRKRFVDLRGRPAWRPVP